MNIGRKKKEELSSVSIIPGNFQRPSGPSSDDVHSQNGVKQRRSSMSQPSYTLPVGVRVIKITRGDVSRHGEQSERICKKYSDQMNFNEVYTRGGHRCHGARWRRWKRRRPLMCPEDSKIHKLSPPAFSSPVSRRNPGAPLDVQMLFRVGQFE